MQAVLVVQAVLVADLEMELLKTIPMGQQAHLVQLVVTEMLTAIQELTNNIKVALIAL